jgi:phosphoribosylanthranilate isomerase
MNVLIKICGLCSKSDLEQVCALAPDAVGFVFWPRSHRFVRPEQVARWLGSIPEHVRKVGVFVEPSAAEVEAIAATCRLDTIQIHLRSNSWKIDRPLFPGLEIWLAPRLDEDGPDIMDAVTPMPYALLADAFDPETIGGTGRTTNLEAALALKNATGRPLVLAGGLTPDNVREAIATVQPWAVDVSSGVEKQPGVKDLRKVKQFIDSVRQ